MNWECQWNADRFIFVHYRLFQAFVMIHHSEGKQRNRLTQIKAHKNYAKQVIKKHYNLHLGWETFIVNGHFDRYNIICGLYTIINWKIGLLDLVKHWIHRTLNMIATSACFWRGLQSEMVLLILLLWCLGWPDKKFHRHCTASKT